LFIISGFEKTKSIGAPEKHHLHRLFYGLYRAYKTVGPPDAETERNTAAAPAEKYKQILL